MNMRDALKPFADYAAAYVSPLPDSLIISKGSSMAKRQLTMGDCRAAQAALRGPTDQETSYRENQAAVERRMILRNQQVIMTALLTFKNMDVDQLRYHIGKIQGYLGAEK